MNLVVLKPPAGVCRIPRDEITTLVDSGRDSGDVGHSGSGGIARGCRTFRSMTRSGGAIRDIRRSRQRVGPAHATPWGCRPEACRDLVEITPRYRTVTISRHLIKFGLITDEVFVATDQFVRVIKVPSDDNRIGN
jgi:hypothetical protein